MNRIDARFAQLQQAGKKAFMPYITAGHPSVETTRDIILTLDRAGADLLELGVPFSDPIADGPSIQQSSEWALQQQTTPGKILELVASVREESQIPISLMSYYNPIFHRGLAEFCQAAAQAGVDGLIVPDLPVEEAGELAEAAAAEGLHLILLVAPTTPAERMQGITDMCGGFVYCVSVTGVTGARNQISDAVAPMLESLRKVTDLPLVVGFGVSTPEQASQMAQMSDGVIVGSAIVDHIHKHRENPAQLIEELSQFVEQLSSAVH